MHLDGCKLKLSEFRLTLSTVRRLSRQIVSDQQFHGAPWAQDEASKGRERA